MKFYPILILLSILLGLFLTGLAEGATYYVATDGDNGGAGTIGDPWETITYGESQLTAEAGDTLYIRAGRYYEEVTLSGIYGNISNQTTIAAYNSEEVIIDGTASVTGWTQCAVDDPNLISGGTVNPNYARIYKVKILTASFPTDNNNFKLFEDSEQSRLASEPNQTYGYTLDKSLFKSLGNEAVGYADRVIDTNLTEAADYWNGGKVSVWLHGYHNHIETRGISDFASGTLTVDQNFSANITNSGSANDAYRIANHPAVLDGSGEYFFVEDPVDDTYTWVYLWPLDTDNLTADIRISTNDRGIYGLSEPYVTLDGLTVFGIDGAGIEFNAYTVGTHENDGVKVLNCVVNDCGGHSMQLDWIHNGEVNNCTVNRGGGYGIHINDANDWELSNTIIDSTISSNVYVTYCNNGIISHNSLQGYGGVHASGFVIYNDNNDILVAHNKSVFPNQAATLNTPSNIYYFGNMFINASDITVTNFSAMTNDIHFIHNTCYTSSSLIKGVSWTGVQPSVYQVNNILHGQNEEIPSAANRTYHCYTGLSSHQDTGSGWGLATGDINEPGLSNVYVDYAAEDFNIPSDSAVRGQGTATITLPTAKWPSYDFSVDLNGTSWANPPSMGALEYAGEVPPVTPTRYFLFRRSP